MFEFWWLDSVRPAAFVRAEVQLEYLGDVQYQGHMTAMFYSTVGG
jgi:hypothetical protein